MSARTKKRRQAGLSREKLIILLLGVVLIVAATALSLHLNGSLTLDNLMVELGLKPPAAVLLENVPDYSGEPYVILQDNQPNFGLEDLTIEPFETYSELDYLGRCGAAYANICLDIMPTEPREEIGQVKPTGWQTVKYDCVDGKYLYNRCHLIGYQLAGENANKRNLITGTRYMNVEGMLPFENMVDGYVEETGNHVLYRVTPLFHGDELVARGVQMEARSIEDEGAGVSFNVYCHNVQPGVSIDYATGKSCRASRSKEPARPPQGYILANGSRLGEGRDDANSPPAPAYTLNFSSRRYHLMTCRSITDIGTRNKGACRLGRDELIALGYRPCGCCKP